MDITFPSMDNYNIEKPGDMALYHAHCDFYPLRGLIETIDLSVKSVHDVYFETANKAREIGDFLTESKSMDNGMIFSARVTPFAYSTIVLTMVAILEEAFNTLCRSYCIINKYSVSYKDITGQGLERALLYLEIVAGVKGIKSDEKWEYVKTIRDARNMIVHNGGRIQKDSRAKFEKFRMYVSEENGQLGFDYETLVKMYDAIIDFIDRVFRIEPTTSEISTNP